MLLKWAVIFFAIPLMASAFGCIGFIAAAATIAKVIVYIS